MNDMVGIPKLYTKDLQKYGAANRKWQGIPSIEITAGGRIYIAFYSGGENEQLGNYCLLFSGDDDFQKPVAAVDAGEKGRCFDPCLWLDDQNRLWFFFATMPKMCTMAMRCDAPDAKAPTFSQPFYACEGVALNKPIVLSDGKYLLPSAVWDLGGCKTMLKICDRISIEQPKSESLAYAVEFDGGGHFEMLGGARSKAPSFDEHILLEKGDSTIVSYIRGKGNIEISFSSDKGRHWSEPSDSGIKNPNSRFFIRRLRSGRILLVNHVDFHGRNNLTAMLSEDEGQTFVGGLLLDERAFVSYPDGAQDDQGYIHIVYDRERGSKNQNQPISAKEILLAKFTEWDVLAGRLISEKGFLKKIVSKL